MVMEVKRDFDAIKIILIFTDKHNISLQLSVIITVNASKVDPCEM